MTNYYQYGKYGLLLLLTLVGLLFSLPNLYGEDPAIQLANKQGAPIKAAQINTIKQSLTEAGITPLSFKRRDRSLLIRFANVDVQLKAKDVLKKILGQHYIVALNLIPKTPQWLQMLGATPLKLGLDLRGGVHFLLHVDVDTVLKARQKGSIKAMGKALRKANIRYSGIAIMPHHQFRLRFQQADQRDQAQRLLEDQFREYSFSTPKNQTNRSYVLMASMPDKLVTQTTDYVIEQAMTILRNRVNELGVSEAVVQRQGPNHVSVDLPGIQDTARAKDLIGKTATLQFHLVDTSHDAAAAIAGNIPAGSRLFYDEKRRPVLLKNRVILKGSAITYATAVFREGGAAVNIRLGGGGESVFHQTTAENIGHPLAVVYIETKVEKKGVEPKTGKPILFHHKKARAISVATIQSALGNNFDITGLGNIQYASNLALLLRSGALEAPVDIVQELTIGPSLGRVNIEKGLLSLGVGALLVVVFMALYYRLFGMIANLALLLNVLLIVAILSILGATLTLPGIAGIVLTVGMAVDANVLINERIREELRRGMSPLASIKAGYELAFSTIVDANVTTLIVAVILFSLGSGTVKGFAVTLIIGLLCSMITSIYFTRAGVELIYLRKKNVKRLSVGI